MAAVHRLITASADTDTGPLRSALAWPAAFQYAGCDLADLAQQGSLTRGLRAVLTHHVLFAWNRLGIPAQQQHLLAATASKVVFRQELAPAPGLVRSPAGPRLTTVSAVTTEATGTTVPDVEQLRANLADYICGRRMFRTPRVEAAFRVVARHLFLPGVDLKAAYEPRVVVTKRAEDGTAMSPPCWLNWWARPARSSASRSMMTSLPQPARGWPRPDTIRSR